MNSDILLISTILYSSYFYKSSSELTFFPLPSFFSLLSLPHFSSPLPLSFLTSKPIGLFTEAFHPQQLLPTREHSGRGGVP